MKYEDGYSAGIGAYICIVVFIVLIIVVAFVGFNRIDKVGEEAKEIHETSTLTGLASIRTCEKAVSDGKSYYTIYLDINGREFISDKEEYYLLCEGRNSIMVDYKFTYSAVNEPKIVVERLYFPDEE